MWTLRGPAARVVLLDPDGRIFLLAARDPADPARGRWWELPGGGLDPGETTEQAARRELAEEAGITDARIGPVIWRQRTRFRFAGISFERDDHIHVAWCDRAHVWRPGGLEVIEAAAFEDAGWFTVTELADLTEPTLPPGLARLVAPIVDGDLPPEPVWIDRAGGC